MRFLADENCDRPIVIALREAGHNVSYVAEWAGGLDDDSVFAAAYEQRRILVTFDHDFGLMAERTAERPPAIVLIRLEQLSPAGRIAAVLDTVSSVGEAMQGRVLIVEPGRVRSRAFKTISS